MDNKRKGASTILVLFMVIVLVTLGLFTILSASVNKNLSKTASNWTQKYYELDSSAEKKVGEIDFILFQSEQKAIDYVINKGYLQDSYNGISDDLQSTNSLIYNNDLSKVYDVMNNTYKTLAYEELEKLSLTDGSEINISYNPNKSVDTLELTNKVAHTDKDELKEDNTFNLLIGLSVNDIVFTLSNNSTDVSTISVDGDNLVGKIIPNKSRYTITSWKQINVTDSNISNLDNNIDGLTIDDETNNVNQSSGSDKSFWLPPTPIPTDN